MRPVSVWYLIVDQVLDRIGLLFAQLWYHLIVVGITVVVVGFVVVVVVVVDLDVIGDYHHTIILKMNQLF